MCHIQPCYSCQAEPQTLTLQPAPAKEHTLVLPGSSQPLNALKCLWCEVAPDAEAVQEGHLLWAIV